MRPAGPPAPPAPTTSGDTRDGRALTVLVQLTRGGVVESSHSGAVAVADADGTLLGGLGEVDGLVYARSAVKPFQALASARLLRAAGHTLAPAGLAVASASHPGTDDAQIEAAHLLALAGLDEAALQCPPTWPLDTGSLRAAERPTALAHNCSGKHAAFLWAHLATGGDPGTATGGYLDLASPVQQEVRDVLTEVTGAAPTGPGVDGCGAPAWRVPLVRLAVGFARLAAGDAGLADVRDAMAARPDLLGGPDAADSALLRADPGVVAKRGAEGVLAAGIVTARGPVGVAVKITDGSGRAALAPAAAVLRALGATVPARLMRAPYPPGRPAGPPPGAWLEPTPYLADWAAELGTGETRPAW